MATQSSILTWKTQWTEESGWFQSMQSQALDMIWRPQHHQLLFVQTSDMTSFKMLKCQLHVRLYVIPVSLYVNMTFGNCYLHAIETVWNYYAHVATSSDGD